MTNDHLDPAKEKKENFKMAAKGAQELAVHSRFSVLANEDSDSSDEETTKGKDVVPSDAKKKVKNAKKRARKKKKAAEAGAASAEVSTLDGPRFCFQDEAAN